MLKDFSTEGDKYAIKILCKLGLSEVRNPDECTSLIYACVNGNLGLVQSLIEGGSKIDAIDKFGNNVLNDASHFGKTDVVRYLISSGFDKDWKHESAGSSSIIT